MSTYSLLSSCLRGSDEFRCAGWLQLGLLVAALGACYVPLGDYMAHIFTTDKHWRVERGIYRLVGVKPDNDQKWGGYVRSMLAFSAISVLFLYGLERLQATCCCRRA